MPTIIVPTLTSHSRHLLSLPSPSPIQFTKKPRQSSRKMIWRSSKSVSTWVWNECSKITKDQYSFKTKMAAILTRQKTAKIGVSLRSHSQANVNPIWRWASLTQCIREWSSTIPTMVQLIVVRIEEETRYTINLAHILRIHILCRQSVTKSAQLNQELRLG